MVSRVGNVSRAAAGLAKARSRGTNITPRNGGVVQHHGASTTPRNHSSCAGVWRQYQNMHMKTNGWADIAYSVGVCPHGYVFAGRGWGVRTAANGTNSGNQNFLAICYIGTGVNVPQVAKDAILSVLDEFRKKGAGSRYIPHRDLTGSACPGTDLIALTRQYDRKAVPAGGSPAARPTPAAELPVHKPGDRVLRLTSPQTTGTDVQAIQRWVGAEDDGVFGNETDTKYRVAQGKVGIPQNGVVDKAGWAHYAAWVKWRAQLAADAAKKAKEQEAKKPPLPRLGAFTGPVLTRSANSGKYHGGVAKAQANLIILGFMRKGADQAGRFGDDTEAGFIALQKARGIKANGKLGRDTWAELERWS